ncbi:MAG: tetratricopeptide repeat protein [Thiobacillus sp.]
MSIRRWIEGCLLAWCVPLAHADACHDALAVFDYARAQQSAQMQLTAIPGDAMAQMCIARAAYETGHFVEALDALRRVETQQPQAALRTYLYNWLTVTLRKLGRDAEAMQYGQVALTTARREPNQQNLATALHNFAGLAYSRGDAVRAVRAYQESIPLNPDLSERSASLNNLGLIVQAQGDRTQAAAWMNQAIALNRAHGHTHHLGKHLMNLGNLQRERGQFAEAQRMFDEGATLIDRVGDRYWQAVAARYRGWLARDERDWATASRWLALAAHRYEVAGAVADAVAVREELSRL